MRRRYLHFFALCISVALALLPVLSLAEGPSCDIAKDAIKAASRIRGLSQKTSVPCYLKTQEEVKAFLLESIDKKIPKERIEGEGFLYKAIGFLPQDFDYVNGLIELYLSQLGGYYDPEKNHYVMAAWLPEMMQPTIAVHELTHALQDQYYNLETFLDDEKYSTDELLARSALLEGDATAVMNDYQREFAGLAPIAKDQNVDAIVMQTVLGSYMAQGLSSAPESLKNVLLFPYVSGLRFVHSALKKGGYKSINAILENPPRSTEEILHPEKYPAKKGEFHEISPANATALGKILHQDTMGEFFISTWLTPLLENKSEGAKSGAGWGGDRAFVIQTPAGARQVLWMLRWDSKEKADEFMKNATTGLHKVYANNSQAFSVSRKGTEVSILIK